jgi:hypothetical protein
MKSPNEFCSGVLTLSGRDKPETLTLAWDHLVYTDRASRKLRDPMQVEMAWVRDVGGPGGVMLRFRTTQHVYDAVKSGEKSLQTAITSLPSPTGAPYGPPMKVGIRPAEESAQFDQVASHLLVFRSDSPRGKTVGISHEANQRSLDQFLEILAGEGIDVAQYESVAGEDGKVEHAMRLFDYYGKGPVWLINTVDRANRLSVAVDHRHLDVQLRPSAILKATESNDSLKSKHALSSSALHPVKIEYGGDESNRSFEEFIRKCLKAGSDGSKDLNQSRVAKEGNGFLTMSVHGRDRDGLFVDCLHVLQTTPTHKRPEVGRRQVLRSCCRGLGEEGFVLAVVPGFAEECDELKEALNLEVGTPGVRRRGTRGFIRNAVVTEQTNRAVKGNQREDVPFLADVDFSESLPTAVGYRADNQLVSTEEFRLGEGYSKVLADLLHGLKGVGGTNVNFLDVRTVDGNRDVVGCAIAVIHSPNSTKKVQALFDALPRLADGRAGSVVRGRDRR